MQAVILAAGKSTRTYPLTLTRPKPLLKIANRTLLEHNLESLKDFVDEVVIIVGYKKNLIKKFLGNKYKNLKIKYVEQKQQLGTGNALLAAEKHTKNDFISLHGDDIYSSDDFGNVLKNKYSILAKKVRNPGAFGVLIEKKGVLVDIIEKPQKPVSNLVNTGLYKLDRRIFTILKKLKKSKRNEYELTDAILALAKGKNVYCVKSKGWIPIGYPWDLLKADRILRKNKNIIGNGSKISGNVANSSIGNSCTIKGIVRNSIIMDKSTIDKNSVVEDSVVGENVYFKGRIISEKNVFSVAKGKKIKIGKFGAVIGDNSRLINVDIKAGCKISPGKIMKNRIIEHDV